MSLQKTLPPNLIKLSGEVFKKCQVYLLLKDISDYRFNKNLNSYHHIYELFAYSRGNQKKII